MRATRRRDRARNFLALDAVLTATALATAPAASAQQAPAPGSSQTCSGVSGGFLLLVHGFGFDFPANTTGTVSFTLANGDVVVLTATTSADGHFRTEQFSLDLRDPENAALVGTSVFEMVSIGGVEAGLSYPLVGCPTEPDGRVACLDGGFESYPDLAFKNSGDCISWIATRGKNEPGQNSP